MWGETTAAEHLIIFLLNLHHHSHIIDLTVCINYITDYIMINMAFLTHFIHL